MLESDLSIAIFAPARRDNFKVDGGESNCICGDFFCRG